jgi:hypothetical protein
MFDLIIESMPELQKLEATVAELERKHAEASARVQALALKVQQAREGDLNREAAALNAGRKVPSPDEPGLREQLDGAGRDAEVLSRRLALAEGDRARYLSEHHATILGLLAEAHASEGERVAAAATEALEGLLRRFAAEDDARGLQRLHPAPQEENRGGPQSMVTVWGPQSTVNAGGGPSRGSLEGTLQYLISLGAPTVIEAGAEDDEGGEDAA